MSRHGQRGASMPEMVIVAGVLLSILFGIIDFSRAMYTYSFVAELAREGARWAIVRGSQCTALDHCGATSGDVQTYLQSRSEGVTIASSISASATWPSCSTAPSNAPGCLVVVTVSYPFHFIAPFVSKAQINMSSTSQMVISQ